MDLTGHLLIAMPDMGDERFARTVVLVSAHTQDGAMGFVLNQKVASPSFVDILEELELETEAERQKQEHTEIAVFSGGPVEQGRGFVLHSLDYGSPGTTRIADLGAMTATLDILRALSGPYPPSDSIMLLGYAGWSAGQLEDEVAHNGWLTLPATQQLVFKTPYYQKYKAALAALGVSEEALSASAGHA